VMSFPVSDPTGINEQLLPWYAGAVAEHNRRKFTVLTITAFTIDDDLLGLLTCRENRAQIAFRMVMIELISPWDVPFQVMLIVAGINKDYQLLLEARVAKEFLRFRSFNYFKALFTQPLGNQFNSTRRIRCARTGFWIRSGCQARISREIIAEKV